ncbi:MAG: hypothetical protein QM639_00860, partial [Rhodocyclaceae bacterium]
MRRRGHIAALACALAVLTAQAEVLTPSAPLTLTAAAGAQRHVDMALAAGDFVAGTLDSGDAPLDYVILAPDGARLRDAESVAAGEAHFAFRAPQAGTYVLRMTNHGAREAALRVHMGARLPSAVAT